MFSSMGYRLKGYGIVWVLSNFRISNFESRSSSVPRYLSIGYGIRVYGINDLSIGYGITVYGIIFLLTYPPCLVIIPLVKNRFPKKPVFMKRGKGNKSKSEVFYLNLLLFCLGRRGSSARGISIWVCLWDIGYKFMG